eukprot:gene29414-5764_t
MERPLPYNVSTQWIPEIHYYTPGIRESGIEDMTIEFKWAPYPSHNQDDGWNGVEFAGASDCWARNLIVLNSDNAITVWKSSFVTITDVSIATTSKRNYYECHHGFNVSYSQDVLATDVGVVFSNSDGGSDLSLHHHRLVPCGTLVTAILVSTYHHRLVPYGTLFTAMLVSTCKSSLNDLSLDHHRLVPYGTLFTAMLVSTCKSSLNDLSLDHHRLVPYGTLFTAMLVSTCKSSLNDLSLDHHRLVPYGTLFTAMLVSTSTSSRAWFSGGIRDWGENQIASTYWNLYNGPQGSVPFNQVPPITFGPQANFIGIHWAPVDWSGAASKGWYREDVVKTRTDFITPANLYESMRETRRSRFSRTLPEWR